MKILKEYTAPDYPMEYQIVRRTYKNGPEDFVVYFDDEVLEEFKSTWKDFVKYAKSKYDVIRASKRLNTVFVK